MNKGLFFLISSVLFSAAPCHAIWFGPKTDSRWAVQSIKLDGDVKKWKLNESDDDSGIAYGFANDSKNLYLMMSPHTKSAQDELAGSYGQDFTVWLDTQAGKEKTIGIHIPEPDNQWDYVTRTPDVIGLDTATVPVSLDNDGVEVKIGPIKERGIVEMRIPLRYLGKSLPDKISVGIETSKAKKDAPHSGKTTGSWQAEQNDSGVSVGMGGRHGGRRGGGRSRSGGAHDEDLSPLSIWVRVALSSQPKTAKQ